MMESYRRKISLADRQSRNHHDLLTFCSSASVLPAIIAYKNVIGATIAADTIVPSELCHYRVMPMLTSGLNRTPTSALHFKRQKLSSVQVRCLWWTRFYSVRARKVSGVWFWSLFRHWSQNIYMLCTAKNILFFLYVCHSVCPHKTAQKLLIINRCSDRIE